MKKFKERYQELTKKLGEALENEISINYEEDSESHNFYGIDQNGNSLCIKFELFKNLSASIEIFLRVKENIYLLPENNNHVTTSISKLHWKAVGLNIEVLEPFSRLRITYNGLLRNIKSNFVEHVQFHFIFTVACSPHYIPEDIDDALLSNFLYKAKSTIPVEELDVKYGFDQFGALNGFIKIKSQEYEMNLPTCRARYRGNSDKFTSRRIFRIVTIDDCGNFFNIVLNWFKNGIAQLEYGFCFLSTGRRYAIKSIDIPESIDENQSSLVFDVKANGKLYEISINFDKNLNLKAINDEKVGYVIQNITGDCKINDFNGKAIVELWKDHEGTKDFVAEPILTSKKDLNVKDVLVCDLKDEQSQLFNLSGGKGCSLAQLMSLKSSMFKVPPGFVVTSNTFKLHLQNTPPILDAITLIENICCGKLEGSLTETCNNAIALIKSTNLSNDIKKVISEQLLKHSNTDFTEWAVRSSAIEEDTEELTAAGQNDTYLNCKTEEEILESVKACWGSLYSYQSVQYRWQNGLSIITDMAVVVQKMVKTESAGVLFTCHPSTCNPSQMVITSTFGLGELVVSGKIDPDTYILERTWDNKISISSKTVGSKPDKSENDTNKFSLTDDQAVKLGHTGVFIEKAFGNARDIEWGFYEGSLFVFQSRPITTLNAWSDYELSHEFDSPFLTKNSIITTANVREVVPKAVTVLTRTSSLKALDWAMQKFVLQNFDAATLSGLTTYQHNIFLDVISIVHKHATDEIRASDITLDLAFFGHPVLDQEMNTIIRNKMGASSTWKKLSEIFWTLPIALRYKEHLKSARSILDAMDLSANDHFELYNKITLAHHDVEELSILHSCTSRSSVFYQICVINILLEGNKEILPDHLADFSLILSSCEDVISAEVPKYIEDISNILIESGHKETFRSVNQSQGVDWLKDNCPKAHDLLLAFLDKHGHRSAAEFEVSELTWSDNPSIVIKMIQANMLGERKKKNEMDIDEVIRNLKSPSSFITRYLVKLLMNRIRVSVGARENTKYILIKGIDFLRKSYNTLGDQMVTLGLIPAKELIFHLTHDEIKQLLDCRNPILIKKAVRRQKLYEFWTKLEFPEIIYGMPVPENDSPLPILDARGLRKGTSVCRGVVQGRACVIRNLDEIHQIKTGDILITYSTDIGWSPYFPILSGVVTELGGLVSHGAVVAREYGLPCIVGVKNVLKFFKTGDMVQLNGNTGEIGLI